MVNGVESSASGGRRLRYLLALVGALLLGLAIAMPVFAQEATTEEDQPVQPQVVGGTAVPDGKYKFVAALLDTRFGSTAYQQQFCGGSLIDRDSVLTAAHCVDGTSARPLRVTVGRTVLSSSQGQTRGVARIFVHPNYNGASSSAFDAAILELGSPVSGIGAVQLLNPQQNGPETPGRLATVAGWGNTIQQPPSGSAGTSYPDRMREAQVPVVSDTRAEGIYGPEYYPSLMVAAGQEGKDTCQGDSGGPLFINASGRYTQVGITSFGYGCGASGYPGVYTEVNASSVRNFVVRAAGS